jgi:CHASE2 domain-containing sensor protein
MVALLGMLSVAGLSFAASLLPTLRQDVPVLSHLLTLFMIACVSVGGVLVSIQAFEFAARKKGFRRMILIIGIGCFFASRTVAILEGWAAPSPGQG